MPRLDITASIAAHLAGEVTTLSVCWRIERHDGVLILGTEHDEDIRIEETSPPHPLAGVYLAAAGITGSTIRSSSDLSVDNMDVTGAVDPGDLNIINLSAADIDAGLFDDAKVTVFVVDFTSPNTGQIVLRSGTTGEISREAEGQYQTELRGLTQALSQPVVRTLSQTCDAELFDDRCGLSEAEWTFEAVVDNVVSRRLFTLGSFGSPAPESLEIFTRGLITFTSGENEDFEMEVRNGDLDSTGQTLLYMPMPRDVSVNDTCRIRAGCDKSPEACKRFNNFTRGFRGHGIFVPGQNEILKVGGQE